MSHWSDELVRLEACEEAVEWAKAQPSYAQAWQVCPRGDWLLWLAGRLCKRGSDEHRAVILAACACARTALKYVPKDEGRPLAAIECAEEWARREHEDIDAVRKVTAAAADANAYTYAYAYAAAYAAYASTAAAYASTAAAAAAYTYAYAYASADASAASSSAYTYAYAAASAAAAARVTHLKKCATIVRRHVSRPGLGGVR